MPPLILILEDDELRRAMFRRAIAAWPEQWRLQFWRSARALIDSRGLQLDRVVLISLDHDLMPQTSEDPGTGLEVACWLAERRPICPVILHTSNPEGRREMARVLTRTGWTLEVVEPNVTDEQEEWILSRWAPVARRLLQHPRASTADALNHPGA